jgi:polysaccharide biosynthesis/export protein
MFPFKTRILVFGLSFLTCLTIIGCRNHSRMFSTENDVLVDSIQKQMLIAQKNYTIQGNDYINVRIYTNKGERLVDPNLELTKGVGTAMKDENLKYLVNNDGKVNLPMVGEVFLQGYTQTQADSVLTIAYGRYYEGAFIVTSILNKRVFVLGPFPLGAKVISLQNENINLIEVIALYGGIPNNGKSYNIRVIRGDLKNPNVNIIDLSTIQGLKSASMVVFPNDIIYIEPVRKLVLESVTELAPILSLLVSITSILIFLTRK